MLSNISNFLLSSATEIHKSYQKRSNYVITDCFLFLRERVRTVNKFSDRNSLSIVLLTVARFFFVPAEAK